jgi:hypothetical protein
MNQWDRESLPGELVSSFAQKLDCSRPTSREREVRVCRGREISLKNIDLALHTVATPKSWPRVGLPQTSEGRRRLTRTRQALFGSASDVRSAGPGSWREGALRLFRSCDAHGHAEPLDAVTEVEVQPPGDPLWQRRDDDLVVLLVIERLANGLVAIGGPDDPLHMRARGRVEQRDCEFEGDCPPPRCPDPNTAEGVGA